MLILLSPAKTLSFDHLRVGTQHPQLMDQAHQLIKVLQTYQHTELKSLMKLSDGLTQINLDRYQSWRGIEANLNEPPSAALFTFNGDVYQGLDASTLSQELVEHAQQHLRILSGLYGVLRPLDHIEPHRLEMGTRLPTQAGKRLYDFWGDDLLEVVETATTRAQRVQEDRIVINLASQEYFTAVNRSCGWSCPVVTPIFRDEKAGKWKVISMFAKRARGLMARHLLEHSYEYPQKTTHELLKTFTSEGYVWSEAESTDNHPVYLRSERSRNQS